VHAGPLDFVVGLGRDEHVAAGCLVEWYCGGSFIRARGGDDGFGAKVESLGAIGYSWGTCCTFFNSDFLGESSILGIRGD
jgi:hypothetical protein